MFLGGKTAPLIVKKRGASAYPGGRILFAWGEAAQSWERRGLLKAGRIIAIVFGRPLSSHSNSGEEVKEGRNFFISEKQNLHRHTNLKFERLFPRGNSFPCNHLKRRGGLWRRRKCNLLK